MRCGQLKYGPQLGQRGDAELRVKGERKYGGHRTIGIAKPSVEPACVEDEWSRPAAIGSSALPAPHSRQQQGSAVQQEDVAEQNPGMILAGG